MLGMREKILLASIGIVIILVMVLIPNTLEAKPVTVCTFSISGTINDDVEVPSGATCFVLAGTTINGDVRVKGFLSAATSTSPITITGDVNAVDADRLVLSSVSTIGLVSVGGDVKAENVPGQVDIRGVNISGDLKVKENPSTIILFQNTIGENLKVKKNSGGDVGGLTIVSLNTVSGNAVCVLNNPSVSGFTNTVAGTNTGCP